MQMGLELHVKLELDDESCLTCVNVWKIELEEEWTQVVLAALGRISREPAFFGHLD